MPYSPESAAAPSDAEIDPAQRRKRPWKAKFGDALRGLKHGIRGHSSFFVHFFFAAIVLAAAVILDCGWQEWCILILCIGLVLTVELFNSAIETLFRGLDEVAKEKSWRCLDISAGAVFMASVIAVVVGAIVLVNRLMQSLQWSG